MMSRPGEADDAGRVVEVMTDALAHRGPDDRGVWMDAPAGIALGHRRLSVIDLSPLGHQPMASASGRWVVSFNGEIYNFKELGKELEGAGRRLRSHCDTEVLVEAIDAWGLRAALRRANAMFSLAAWDRQEGELHLARDRVGEKPLYYGRAGRHFVFGSELKALTAHPHFVRRVDRDALALYMRYNCVPAPCGIYEGVSKLRPGHSVVVRQAGHGVDCSAQASWWSPEEILPHAAGDGTRGGAEARRRLEDLLVDAVRLRTVADVPVGAFLSGGIDSSLVAALMTECSARVRTYTIGFEDRGFDESADARRVARWLGTDHTEAIVGTADAQSVIPELPGLYDEPFADSSQIPTLLVSRLARQQVTVALSGDGGDELFAGYNRHLWWQRFAGRLERVPVPVRRAAAAALGAPSPDAIEWAFGRLARVLPAARVRNPSLKVRKVADILALPAHDAYLRLVSHWPDPGSVVNGARQVPTLVWTNGSGPHVAGRVEQILYLDLVTYLPDDILTKVDRATMAVGLEGRLPLLDHRVLEAAWQLPMSMKIRGGETKHILRQILYSRVPRELADRPKMGFGVPLRQWLVGGLRDWAEQLLSRRALDQGGFLAPGPVRKLWDAHVAGEVDASHPLWDVLMFQAWAQRWTPT